MHAFQHQVQNPDRWRVGWTSSGGIDNRAPVINAMAPGPRVSHGEAHADIATLRESTAVLSRPRWPGNETRSGQPADSGWTSECGVD